MKLLSAATIITAMLISPAIAQDIEKGEKNFKKCTACHMVQDADGNAIVKGGKVGPNLFGLAGRVVGSLEGAKYSKSAIALGETGLAWTEDEFVKYVANPTAYFREKLNDSKAKGNMSFRLKKEEDARNIWAFLLSTGS